MDGHQQQVKLEFDVTSNCSLVNLCNFVFIVKPLFIYKVMVLIIAVSEYAEVAASLIY